MSPENCARCMAPLDDGESHCNSGLCWRCYSGRLNEDREQYPITELDHMEDS